MFAHDVDYDERVKREGLTRGDEAALEQTSDIVIVIETFFCILLGLWKKTNKRRTTEGLRRTESKLATFSFLFLIDQQTNNPVIDNSLGAS